MRRRPSTATIIGAAGVLLVLLAAFLPWYRFAGDSAGGAAIGQVAQAEHLATTASFWKARGTAPDVLLVVLVAVVCAALAAHTAAPRERAPAAIALAAAVALLALVLTWVLGMPGPDELVTRSAGAWIALGGASAAVAGAFLALDAAAAAPPTSSAASAAPAPR